MARRPHGLTESLIRWKKDVFYIILLLVVVFAIGIPLSIAHQRKTRENWLQAAKTLGLQFQGGNLFKTNRIQGVLNGNSIQIETYTKRSGKHSTTYTRFRIRYPRPLGLGLKITREGFFSGLAKLLGMQDIRVGDDNFDRTATVKGADPRRIQAFLTPARRIRIQRVLSNYPEVEINDQEIYLQRHGVMRKSEQLVRATRALERLAWFLSGDRSEDVSMSAAMEAQDAGHPDEALRILRDAERQRVGASGDASEEVIDAQLAEERLLEGEILYLAGRDEESADYFSRARKESPQEPEIELWANRTANAAERNETASHQPAADTSPTPGSPILASVPLDTAGFCETVFQKNTTSFAANDRFEQQYAGREVEWSGPLRRLERMSYDMVFGDEEACRATFEIHSVEDASYLNSAIKAFLKLPLEDVERLRGRVGQHVTFTGRLLKLDAFMRNVYLEEGAIVD